MPGIVDKVIDHPDQLYSIVAIVQDPHNDDEWVVTRTIHTHNQDPIPNVIPGNPSYHPFNFIRLQDESIEGLSDITVKHWHCLKYHSGGATRQMKLIHI